jgi:hypothetical protein
MAKTLQEFLNHYHTQSLLKKPFALVTKEKLAVVNQYDRIFDVNSEVDVIMLDVYHQSTLSKNTIKEAIDVARNKVFDIWPNLDNNQKNHLLQVELKEVFASLPQFVVNDTPIVVAFFDDLLNALLVKRTAVFELPQFFRLYKNYKESVINPKEYGHQPFEVGFSTCTLVYQQDASMVLFHPTAKIMFEIKEFYIIKRFPLLLTSSPLLESLKQLAVAMVENNNDVAKEWLLSHDVLSKAAFKASKRKGFIKIVKMI